MKTAQDVLNFWLDELSPKDWYAGGDALDAQIRDRFEPTWQAARDGHLDAWLNCSDQTLAYILVTDQFPRNMYRGLAQAFETDGDALAACKMAVDRNWDLRIAEPARQFLYMPLMHSESLCDQDRAVRLFKTRMPETGGDNIDHARAHREVIRRYGRFPYRNDALDRRTTGAEAAFLSGGGYGAILEEVRQGAAA